MARISRPKYDEVTEESKKLWDDQVESHGRMTHMKQTLAHSSKALGALMEWYPLRDEVAEFLGDRPTTLFAHAISSATDCLICSTFFRRILKDAGEDPDNLSLNEEESLIVEYGRALSKQGHRVSADLFDRLKERYSEKQLVSLTAFGGMMVATNLFNNALEVDLDDYLEPYRGIQ